MRTERLIRAGRVSWSVTGILALVAVAGLVVWTFRVVLPPLILAGTIVFLLNPIVTRLQHRGIPRAGGAALAYLGVLALVGLTVVLVVPLAAEQAGQLQEDWPEISARATSWIDARAESSQGTFYEFSREDIEGAVAGDNQSFAEQLEQLKEIGALVFHALIVLILGPIIGFYLLVDLPNIRKVTESLIPDGARAEAQVVGHRLNHAIGGFFRGQLLVALIVGIICSIALGLVGIKFWFLVGMIAGLFNIIPLVGPWIGGIPGVVIALTTGAPWQAGAVVAVMVGAQQVDNHFITPYVMQRAVRLHPAVVMLALLAGGTLGGFSGLLLAVPVAAVLKIILGHIWRTHVLGEPLEQIEAEQEIEDADTDEGPVKDVVHLGDGRDRRDHGVGELLPPTADAPPAVPAVPDGADATGHGPQPAAPVTAPVTADQ